MKMYGLEVEPPPRPVRLSASAFPAPSATAGGVFLFYRVASAIGGRYYARVAGKSLALTRRNDEEKADIGLLERGLRGRDAGPFVPAEARGGDGMSTKTTHTCDKSGRTEDANSFLFSLSINVAGNAYYGKHETHGVTHEALPKRVEWCGECCEKLGVAAPKRKLGEAKPEEPIQAVTIEDFIREIVQQEIGWQQQ